jgi:carboxypeptidase Ss1
MHSGSMHNIIPSEAVLEGTMRTLDERFRSNAKKLIIHVTTSICKTFGAQCEVEFVPDTYPVTRNDQRVAGRVREILSTIEGTRTVECDPILGGEDVSRFLQMAPGAYYFLGIRNEKKGCVYPNHSSKFKVDEDVLKFGSVSLAKLAMEFGSGQ